MPRSARLTLVSHVQIDGPFLLMEPEFPNRGKQVALGLALVRRCVHLKLNLPSPVEFQMLTY